MRRATVNQHPSPHPAAFLPTPPLQGGFLSLYFLNLAKSRTQRFGNLPGWGNGIDFEPLETITTIKKLSAIYLTKTTAS